jgi:hypothetical protein
VNVSVQEHRAVVELMDIIAMWLIDIFFSFCGIVVCKSYAYFIMLSPRLSCLHFYFLASRPGMGGI